MVAPASRARGSFARGHVDRRDAPRAVEPLEPEGDVAAIDPWPVASITIEQNGASSLCVGARGFDLHVEAPRREARTAEHLAEQGGQAHELVAAPRLALGGEEGRVFGEELGELASETQRVEPCIPPQSSGTSNGGCRMNTTTP